MRFDAALLLSFGGPDGPDDVRPFLAHVLGGRPVPPERLEQVASHYMLFGGRSPINDQNRAILAALDAELTARGRSLPLYWGNRNWTPFLPDTVARMRDDGIQRAAVFVTSAYSSFSSCRQYLDDLAAARQSVGRGAPELVKLRPYFNHPGFVEPFIDGLRAALAAAPPGAPVLMSAHSIPLSMAAACDYERQLGAVAAVVADGAGVEPGRWTLVYQSRSGTPDQPWLGPDILDTIADLPGAGGTVVVVPIGFVSDHMEVIYDLDTEARGAAEERGWQLVRIPTPSTDPRFVQMIGQLVDEMEEPDRHPARTVGGDGPAPCPCPAGCARAAAR